MGNSACRRGEDEDVARTRPTNYAPGDEAMQGRSLAVAEKLQGQILSIQRSRGENPPEPTTHPALAAMLRQFFELLDKDHDQSIDQSEWTTVFTGALDWVEIRKARRSHVDSLRVSQENLQTERLTLLDWDHIFGGAAVGHAKAVERAENLSDRVDVSMCQKEVAGQHVEILVGWGIPQGLATIALRDAPANDVSALDCALEYVQQLWGFAGASGLIGAVELDAPEEITRDMWAVVQSNGCLAMHQKTAGVEDWMESDATVVRLLQLPIDVGWTPGSTRIELENPTMLEPKTGSPLEPAPAKLYFETASAEDAEFWLKVLQWNGAVDRAAELNPDASKSGHVWVTEMDIMGCKQMHVKKWATLTSTQLTLVPMADTEGLEGPYCDQSSFTMESNTLDVGSVEEDGELRGPMGQIGGTLRLYDPTSRKTVDLYHTSSSELQEWHDMLLHQHNELMMEDQRRRQSDVQAFQRNQPNTPECDTPPEDCECMSDSMLSIPPAFTSPVASAVTQALLKFGKSTGQAFASGAFLVHDQWQEEDHALFNILSSDPASYARVSKHLQHLAPPKSWFSRKPLTYGIDIEETAYDVLPKTGSDTMTTESVVKRSVLFGKLVLNGRPLLYFKPTARTAPQRESGVRTAKSDEEKVPPEYQRSEVVPGPLGEWFANKSESLGLSAVESRRALKAGVFAMVELFEESHSAEAEEALTELRLWVQESIKSKLESADVRNGIGWEKTQSDDVLGRVWHVYDLENKPENSFKFRIGEEVYVPHRVTADIMNGIESATASI